MKQLLIQCVTPEAILRPPYSELQEEYEALHDMYFKQQKHESLQQYLQFKLREARRVCRDLQVQVLGLILFCIHLCAQIQKPGFSSCDLYTQTYSKSEFPGTFFRVSKMNIFINVHTTYELRLVNRNVKVS